MDSVHAVGSPTRGKSAPHPTVDGVQAPGGLGCPGGLVMYGGHFPPLGEEDRVATPPVEFRDQDGRTIGIRVYGNGPVDDEVAALVDMYGEFGPEDRSLGVPPRGDDEIREWLDVVTEDYGVLAWHEDRAVGQAVLVDESSGYELAIFVHPDYHGAGIGTRLTEVLLSYGGQRGVRHVWLLVERDNRLAVNLYREVGFTDTADEGPDVKMEVDVTPLSGSRVTPGG